MKRIGKKIIPLFLALLILVGVPLSSYNEVKATGVEEYLYYTYWDLMNSLYAMTGYDMKISKSEIKNHGVSGKQTWKNFTSFVDNTAKIHWKLYSDAGSSAIKELKNLVNTVTEKGISISQDLYDMLKDVFGYQVVTGSSGNYSEIKSFEAAAAIIAAVCGTSVRDVPKYGTFSNTYLQMFSDISGKIYCIQTDWPVASMDSARFEYCGGGSSGGLTGITYDTSSGYISGVMIYGSSSYTWIVHNGNFVVSDDVIGVQVSAGACPKEVPDVSPWIKHTDVPDEWRIVKPNETPDPDDDNDGDALPVVIPIHPTPDKPDKPDETEKEDSTEKPDNDLVVLINPSTGNQIDPNTGLDIDPDTGYLIDPDTGQLIDPKTGKKFDRDKVKNRIKNLPSIMDRAGNITKYFPFCIPWDMMELVKTLKADKKAPRFTFKYTFKEINYTWVVDVNMADYWKYIKIFRWGMTIFFIIGLFFLTTKITTFVHRMSG